MNPPRDPELEALFDDTELLEAAELLRSVPRHRPDPDPLFRASLRRQLMQEAWERAAPQQPFWRRLLSPGGFAWASATVGVVLIAFVAYTLASNPFGQTATHYWNSPLQDAQAVATVQPIEIDFSQPMDHGSVEQSIQIQPATSVTYQWQGNSLRITPVHNLAPNTQYQVNISADARTQTGHSIPAQPAVTFVTAPRPAPSPATSPAPSPTSIPSPTAPAVSGARQVGPVGRPAPQWAPDASALYIVRPGGALEAAPLAGGQAVQVAPDGVTLVAVGPTGVVAYARGGLVQYGQQKLPSEQPLAIGFRDGRLIVATPKQVVSAGGDPLSLDEDALGAQFAPNGATLAYIGGSGLHLVDLASGKDTLVGPVTALGAWSPAGDSFAYSTATAVWIAGLTGQSAKLADLAGVTAASWSSSDELLLATAGSLSIVDAKGSGIHELAVGSFAQPAWAPAGSAFSFERSGDVFVAEVAGGKQAPAAPSQDDILAQFMQARTNGDALTAGADLDPAGKDAFSQVKLAYPAQNGQPRLARYDVVLSQPGRAVVRLVLASGQDQTQVLETLSLVRYGGRSMIHGVTETQPLKLGPGPNALSIKVTASQVSVAFDADLDPSTVAGVSIKGLQAQTTYDAGTRTVVLSVPGGLTPGGDYQLAVSGSLTDVDHDSAASLRVGFSGPAS